MRRVQVESSSITAVGYDHQTGTLEIVFSGGEIYRYFEVPRSVYDELMASKSKGAFVNARIKQVFPFDVG